MKIALTILCSLLLVLGQAAALSAPVATVGQAGKTCGCGGKMNCCQKTSAPQPITATAPVGLQNQFLSLVPAVEVWVLTSDGTSEISPNVFPSLSFGAAPIFTRNCARLI